MKPKYQFIYLSKENEFMVPNLEKKRDYSLNPCLSQLTDRLWFSKMAWREVFLMRLEHQYHLSRWEKCVYDAQTWKEKRLLCEFMFFLIDEWTLIVKTVGSEVFLMTPKHLYHLS